MTDTAGGTTDDPQPGMGSSVVPVPGSHRDPVPGAERVADVDPAERIEVSVRVRSRGGGTARAAAAEVSAQPPGRRSYLSRAGFAAAAGADQADLEAVAAFASALGLEVIESSASRRTVRLAGDAAAMQTAFGVELGVYEFEGSSYRGREGSVLVPAGLSGIVQAVLGLDDRPQLRTRLWRGPQTGSGTGSGTGRVRPEAVSSHTAVEVAKLYDFPVTGDGAGQCIGIIELGGGYSASDLSTYFSRLRLPVPTVVSVSVDGGTNDYTGDPNSADGEVLLDIQIAGAVAPGARIAVYFAPNTDAGFLDAVTTAVHDEANAPSVVSISWGAPESDWTVQSAGTLDDAFAEAATLGVTICAASGDNGSADRASDGLAHADFPASSPHALGCGGTVLNTSGGSITSEAVWNGGDGGASGGGVSDLYDLPDYQRNAGVPPSVNRGGRVGRGVPDVCGDADPASGYQVVVGGRTYVFGGTSAVAPLWAGLLALVDEALPQPVGLLHPVLYGTLAGTPALVDITRGNNRVSGLTGYDAEPGWDACTGLGRPSGRALLAALAAAAGPAPVG